MLPFTPTGPGEPWRKTGDANAGAAPILRQPIRLALLFFMSFPTTLWCLLRERPSHPGQRDIWAKTRWLRLRSWLEDQAFISRDVNQSIWGLSEKQKRRPWLNTCHFWRWQICKVLTLLKRDVWLSLAHLYTIPCTHTKQDTEMFQLPFWKREKISFTKMLERWLSKHRCPLPSELLLSELKNWIDSEHFHSNPSPIQALITHCQKLGNPIASEGEVKVDLRNQINLASEE